MPNKDLKKDISQTDPFVKKFFARIPPDTAATFTNTQLAELKRIFQARVEQRHSVDIRLSVPIFKRRFYLVYLLGKETRRLKRVQAPVSTPANRILVTISGFVLITSLLGTLHIVNKLWGLNMFPDQAIKESIRVLLNKD
ncbi:hypothetical protein [Anabaena sp. CCY 9402-a]|uniref:hypothetical protein n=1 Tax=Anabaena sp. CCY 9402-a TaxID=3103867 RepID=UPI0039C655BB